MKKLNPLARALQQEACKLDDLGERLAWLRATVVEHKDAMKTLQYLCRETFDALESFSCSSDGNDQLVKGKTGKGRSYRFCSWHNDDAQ